jgi:P27 family predicted phage terminase small subunit
MKPYFELTSNGKEIFNNIYKHMNEAKVFEVDRYLLTILADAFDEYMKCTAVIRVEGYRNSHDQISPEVSNRDKSFNTIVKISPLFGIDIKSRESIKAFAEKPIEDELAKMLKK